MKKLITHHSALFTAVSAALITLSLVPQAQRPVIEAGDGDRPETEQNAQDIPLLPLRRLMHRPLRKPVSARPGRGATGALLTVNEAIHKQTSSFSIRGIGTNVYGTGVGRCRPAGRRRGSGNRARP